jgi:hypothetical protein
MKKAILFLIAIIFSVGLFAQKITALTEATAASGESLLLVRDGSTGNVIKKITKDNLLSDYSSVDDLALKLSIANGTTTGTLTTANIKIGSAGEVLSKAALDNDGFLTFFDVNGDSLSQHTNDADKQQISDIAVMIGDAERDVLSLQSLGATSIKGWSISTGTGENQSLYDGYALYQMVEVFEDDTITGIQVVMGVAGDYTADNNNYVALFSVSGGTYTQVAISANNGDLWKATANTIITVAFTAPYVATKGVYAVGMMYNSSAETARPQFAGENVKSLILSAQMTNSNHLCAYLAAQTAFPASETGADLTLRTGSIFIQLYE